MPQVVGVPISFLVNRALGSTGSMMSVLSIRSCCFQFMVEHFKTIGSPIKGVHKYFDTKRQARRYKDCGWQECRTKSLTEVWNSFDEEEINKITETEVKRH